MMKKRNEKGFTLVEIAIVLVIIGLILGGVLKGQEIIQNAKEKRIKSDIDGFTAAIFSYQDRYDYLPGDDPNAVATLGASVNGNNNGIWDAAERDDVYEHLRLARFITGSGMTPKPNPFGGQYLFFNRSFGGAIGTRNCIQVAILPNAVGGSLDTKYDDGVHNTGTIQASAAYNITGLITVWFSL